MNQHFAAIEFIDSVTEKNDCPVLDYGLSYSARACSGLWTATGKNKARLKLIKKQVMPQLQEKRMPKS